MRIFPVLMLVLTVGCTDIIYPPTSPSPTTTNPTPTPVPVAQTKIEFRVTGNASGVRVRYSNAVDGLTQVVTTMPYIATVTITETSMFLSLEATPTSYNFSVFYPYMTVQIFANGILFREASSNEFLLNTLSVSGTWRK